MDKLAAYRTILTFIRNERYMRDRVFGPTAKGARKVAECDKALEALEILRQYANVPLEKNQGQQGKLL